MAEMMSKFYRCFDMACGIRYGRISGTEFSKTVARAVLCAGVEEIRNRYGLSLATLLGWLKGEVVPRPASMEAILMDMRS